MDSAAVSIMVAACAVLLVVLILELAGWSE